MGSNLQPGAESPERPPEARPSDSRPGFWGVSGTKVFPFRPLNSTLLRPKMERSEAQRRRWGQTYALPVLPGNLSLPGKKEGPSRIWLTQNRQRVGLTPSFAAILPRLAYLPARSSARIGSRRIRFPAAAKIALHTAGAAGGTPGSPTPPGASWLSTIETSTAGISRMRSIW